MQDKNFDDILKQKLSASPSFGDNSAEDWSALVDRLDVVLPQRKRRIPALWLWSAGLLVMSSFMLYMLYQWNIVEQKIGENASKTEQFAETTTTFPQSQATTTLPARGTNENATHLATPSIINPTTTVTSSSNNKNNFNAILPTLTYPQTTHTSTTVSTTNNPSAADNHQPSTAFNTTDSHQEESSLTNVPLMEEQEIITNKLIEKKQSEEKEKGKKEKTKPENKPFAFFTPIKKGIHTAKENPDMSRFLNNTYKDTKQKLDLATVVSYIIPDGYRVGANVGRGLSPLQFENENDDIIEGTFSYGLQGEFLFGNNFRIALKVDALRQNLVYHGAEASAPPPRIEPPSDQHHLAKTLATENFLQGTIGVKAVMNPSNHFRLYAGIGLPAQMRVRQSYEYAFKLNGEEEVEKETFIDNQGGIFFNSFNFNSGVEYKLTENVSLNLEGTYNVQIPERQGYLPDIFSLNVGLAYNWYDSI